VNKVIREGYLDKEYRLSDLIHGMYDHTAFIGQCGDGPAGELYLITYSGIVLAEAPIRFWSGGDAAVLVKRFVDVEIRVLDE
jgi:hypothetical protein